MALALLAGASRATLDIEWHATQDSSGSSGAWVIDAGSTSKWLSATDGASGSFVAGGISAYDVSLGGTVYSSGATCILLARVSSSGAFTWVKQIGYLATSQYASDVQALAVTDDGSGGVWLLGKQGLGWPRLGLGSFCLGNTVGSGGTCPTWSLSTHPSGDCPTDCVSSDTTSSALGHMFLARIDGSGNVVHAASIGGIAVDMAPWTAYAASDSSGNLFVAAKNGGAYAIHRFGSHTVTPTANSPSYLFKFNKGTLDFDWVIPCGVFTVVTPGQPGGTERVRQ